MSDIYDNYRKTEQRLLNSEAYKLMPSLLADKELDALFVDRQQKEAQRRVYTDASSDIRKMVLAAEAKLTRNTPSLERELEQQKGLAGLGENNALYNALEKHVSALNPAANAAHDNLHDAVIKKIQEAGSKNPAIETDMQTLDGVAYKYEEAKSAQAKRAAGRTLSPEESKKDNEVYDQIVANEEEFIKSKGKAVLKIINPPAGREREDIYAKYEPLKADTAIYIAQTIDKASPEKAEAMVQLFTKLKDEAYDNVKSVANTREAIRYAQNTEALKSDSFIQQKLIPGLSIHASQLQAHNEKYFPPQEKNTPQAEIPGEQAKPLTPANALPSKTNSR